MKIKIIYFAGGNRLETLQQIVSSDSFIVTQIYVANIETNLEKYKIFANENKIDFTIANKNNIDEFFKFRGEEVLLSVGYRFIIPETVFSVPKYAINIHPSLLPKYKGAYSGYAIIENGEKETGLTAHFIDKGIDTGDIINQKSISLDISDTIISMSEKILKIEPNFVIDTLDLIKNKKFNRIKQVSIPNDIVYNKKRTPEDSKIDLSIPLANLLNKIRACDQERFPAYFMIGDKKVNIRLEFENEK